MTTPPVMGDMLAKIAGLKTKMDEAVAKAAEKTVKATVGGGMVTATANGRQELVRIEIDAQALGDKAMLEDLVVAACNQALAQTKGLAQEAMQKVIADMGLPLPPGFDLSKMF